MVEDVPGTPAENSTDLDKNACNPRRKTARARVTNHADLLPDLDGRSSAARRFRDLVAAFVADMGGIDQVSEIKLGLLRRLAAVTVLSEIAEADMVNTAKVDIPQLCQLASTAMRLSVRVGLSREARDVGPTFGDMLRADIAKRRRRAERLEARP